MHVAYSPDGRFLVSASRDGTAKLWDPWTLVEPAFFLDYPGRVTALEPLPESRLLVATDDGSSHVWDVDRRAHDSSTS